MKALTFHGKENIAYESVPDPEIEEPTDVIVQVSSCAVCGSDLHPYYEREKGLDHGCVMGHEFTGEIVAIGRDIKNWSIGNRVMSPFTTACGACFYCRKGLTCRCERGQLFGWVSEKKGLQGGQAELVRVPLADYTLMPVPDGAMDETALLLGDILSTGYYCAEQAGIRPDEVQVVVGCGPVGLMAIWAAKKMGAQQLFAIDAIPERLEKAAQWGAIPLNYKEVDPLEAIREATHGRGADAAMEAVGMVQATRSAYELIRPGGTLSAVGVCTSTHIPFSPVEAYDKNITYKIGRCPARHYMGQLSQWALEDQDRLNSIFTHRWALSRGKEAYHTFANKQDHCLKVLLHTSI
jgi:threonine dehydrogenase-like Zn-dependent dehydrogenase